MTDLDIKALYVDTVYVAVPTVVITAMGTYTDNNRPTVAWTNTLDADGGGQARYEVKVFNQATYGAGGFDVDTSTDYTDASSGVLNGGATSWRGTVGLPNTNYKAYVRVAQLVNGEEHWSAWDEETFTITVPVPGTPTVETTPEDSAGRVRVDVTNVAGSATTDWLEVEVNDAGATAIVEDGFDTDTVAAGLWSFDPLPGGDDAVAVVGGELTITSTTNEKHLHRVGTSISDGVVTAKFTTGTNDIGHGRVSMKHRASSDGTATHWFAFDFNIQTNLCRLRYKAPNPVGATDGNTGGTGALATSTDYWAQIEMVGDTAYGRLYNADPFGTPAPTPIGTRTLTLPAGTHAAALGEGVFGAPGLAFFSGTDTNWTADDWRAEGIAEPDPTTWRSLRTLEGDGVLPFVEVSGPDVSTGFDYEAPPGRLTAYRARAVHEYGVDVTGSSPWSILALETWESDEPWIKHPFDPGLNMTVRWRSQPAEARPGEAAVHKVLGRSDPIVTRDAARIKPSGEITFFGLTPAIRTALDALIDTGDPLLLQFPNHDVWPNRWCAILDHSRERVLDSEITDSALGRWEVFGWQEVGSPSGALEAWS